MKKKTAVFPRSIDLSVTYKDKICLAVALLCTILINLSPINNSIIVLPVVCVMAITCFLSPFTAFYYIAFSQHFPEFVGTSLNMAQIGVIAWVVVLPFQKQSFKGARNLFILLPLLFWILLASGTSPVSFALGYYENSIIYALIACQQLNLSKGRYFYCLLGLSLGALAISAGFWLKHLGFPVILSNWGSLRGGMMRVGGVGTDAVMVWPAVLMGLAGIMGISINYTKLNPKFRMSVFLRWGVLIALLLCVPVLFVTVTNAAYAGLALLMSSYLFMLYRSGLLKRLVPLLAVLCVIFLMMFSFNIFRIGDALRATNEGYEASGGGVGTRGDVWRYSIKTIEKFPFLGVRGNNAIEVSPPEYAHLQQGTWLSHNVFLDYGRAFGIPTILLYITFYYFPLWKMYRSKTIITSAPFLLWYFIVTIFLFVLSFGGYKTIWAFWMITAMFGDDLQYGRRLITRHELPERFNQKCLVNGSSTEK